MKLNTPKNKNYCATVVEITNIIPLKNCDNVVHTNIFGNLVIISKDTHIKQIGIFFPPETQLSKEFLMNNNLYRHKELNKDKEKIGWFEDNGRIKTVKFRTHPSMGFYVPIKLLEFIDIDIDHKLDVGDEFDEINGIPICNKFIRKIKNKQQANKERRIKESKLVEKQFAFHGDTYHLGKNLFRFEEDTLISITKKMHGTSLGSSKLLCKRKLNWFEKFLRFCKIKINDVEYDYIYNSRSVIKNDDIDKVHKHFYKSDIWEEAHKRLAPYLLSGMSVYAEIVGYTETGSAIQSFKGKAFDYGCEAGTFEIYIYRITQTNVDGMKFEFSAKQVQDWCKSNGLNPIPELYYGKASRIFDWIEHDYCPYYDESISFQDNFYNELKRIYLEKDCNMCKNGLPDEGIVVRIEGLHFDAYKMKSFKFLELESKNLDSDNVDIEEDQSQE